MIGGDSIFTSLNPKNHHILIMHTCVSPFGDHVGKKLAIDNLCNELRIKIRF